LQFYKKTKHFTLFAMLCTFYTKATRQLYFIRYLVINVSVKIFINDMSLLLARCQRFHW